MNRSATLVDGKADVDLETFIDERHFGRPHVLLIGLCALAAAIDGFDAQLITYLAPSIARDLHLSRAMLGPVFSLGIVGMAFGSLAGGMLADRFGRRPIILLSLLWFGVFSILTAFSATAGTLIALRFISGLGYGALMPNAAALVAEFAPRRYRATAVMVMYCGVAVGGALGGPVTALVLEHHGWHFLFVMGGVLGLLIALLLGALLPESIRFLLAAGGSRERLQKSMRFIDPAYSLAPDARLVSASATGAGRVAVRQLFLDGRLPVTLLLWSIFLCAALDLYFIVTWLPTILQDHGVEPRESLLVTSMFQLGGLLFPLVLARMIDGKRAIATVGCIFGLGAVTTCLIGSAGTSVASLGLLVFLTGAFVQGGMTGLTAISAGLYPTLIRSSGVGWALGLSRVGGIIGPMLGAAAVAAGLSFQAIFAVFAIPAIIAALAAAGLVRVTRRQPDPR
ncbi:MAG: MFS transporter [Candidatus Sphingomonas phytovorans]|nr:MFS transporter [Sphingomonas sp.]WEK02305.1 MAG: MFS transporter [Sphingomonas sp.]